MLTEARDENDWNRTEPGVGDPTRLSGVSRFACVFASGVRLVITQLVVNVRMNAKEWTRATDVQIIDVIGYLLKGHAYHAASNADRADHLAGLWGLGW